MPVKETGTKSKTSVSIIVSFYERMAHLKCCLDALSACMEDFDEVVVADDGSSEETVKVLGPLFASYPFRIVHAWHPKEGFRLAASRNNGIRRSRGDYLVFLDCDFAVLPGTIRCHTGNARRGRFVAGLCKYLPEESTRLLMEQGMTPERLEELYKGLSDRPIVREHRKFIRYSILIRLGLANPGKQRCSSHFSIHRTDMESVNGYDENFVGWGGEDQDLSFRMVKGGLKGYSAIAGARMLHLWHPKELGDKHWREGPNMPYFTRAEIPAFCENGLVKSGVNAPKARMMESP